MQDSKTAIFKDRKNFLDNGREDRLNSSSPHPKILPVNQPSFPNTAAMLLIPYAFLVKRLLTEVAANPPMLVPS